MQACHRIWVNVKVNHKIWNKMTLDCKLNSWTQLLTSIHSYIVPAWPTSDRGQWKTASVAEFVAWLRKLNIICFFTLKDQSSFWVCKKICSYYYYLLLNLIIAVTIMLLGRFPQQLMKQTWSLSICGFNRWTCHSVCNWSPRELSSHVHEGHSLKKHTCHNKYAPLLNLS